jgi:hypothetical protein
VLDIFGQVFSSWGHLADGPPSPTGPVEGLKKLAEEKSPGVAMDEREREAFQALKCFLASSLDLFRQFAALTDKKLNQKC